MQALASNAVVAEVAEHVGEVCQAVVLSAEAQVALIIEPGSHGAAAGHQHPLPNVKLPEHRSSCFRAVTSVQVHKAVTAVVTADAGTA